MPARKLRTTRAARVYRDPPTVAKVRAIRQKLWKEAGGDVGKAMEIARREASAFLARRSGAPKRKTKRAA